MLNQTTVFETTLSGGGSLLMEEIGLLKQLCSIQSPSKNEQKVAQYLVQLLKQRGWRAHLDGAGNVVGEIGHGPKTLLFLGHIDTAPGFIPVQIKDGCLYGRGSVDAKGPIAAFLSAVDRNVRSLNMRIVFIGAVEEETPFSTGARHIVSRYSPDYCIIGEPSGWSAVTIGYKGYLGFSARVCCSTGHSAGPSASAPELAIVFWNSLLALCQEINSGKTDFASIEPSLNRIWSGNDGLQDVAEISGGLRLPEGCNLEALIAQINSLHPGVELTFLPAQEGFKASKNTALARAFLRSIRQQGGRPVFKVKSGTADMNIVGPAWKCPILAYGPGDSSLDHSPNEHLSLCDYSQSISVLSLVLTDDTIYKSS